jgi:hypothetical protein
VEWPHHSLPAATAPREALPFAKRKDAPLRYTIYLE